MFMFPRYEAIITKSILSHNLLESIRKTENLMEVERCDEYKCKYIIIPYNSGKLTVIFHIQLIIVLSVFFI